jgi:hypothetical protein
MNKKELAKHIGEHVTIINGKYSLASTGDFIISEDFGMERVWLPKEGKPQCITTQPFIGRSYRLGKVDCVTLVCEYLKSDSLLKFYKGLSLEALLKLQRSTVMAWLDSDSRFTDVGNDYVAGDCVVYTYTKQMHANHIGIVMPEGKILHHLPNKVSCIDPLNSVKVEKGYRFNE